MRSAPAFAKKGFVPYRCQARVRRDLMTDPPTLWRDLVFRLS
jgi:hypothetical protein